MPTRKPYTLPSRSKTNRTNLNLSKSMSCQRRMEENSQHTIEQAAGGQMTASAPLISQRADTASLPSPRDTGLPDLWHGTSYTWRFIRQKKFRDMSLLTKFGKISENALKKKSILSFSTFQLLQLSSSLDFSIGCLRKLHVRLDEGDTGIL